MSSLKRVRMNDSRYGTTRRISVSNFDVYITVNMYDNGQPGEVFATVGKAGGTVSGFVNATCVMISMLLQVGVPAKYICDKIRHTRFEPSDDTYSSIADAIAVAIERAVSFSGGNSEHDYENKPVDWHGTQQTEEHNARSHV